MYSAIYSKYIRMYSKTYDQIIAQDTNILSSYNVM